MAANTINMNSEEIDEAEEEALLRSDDETEPTRARSTLNPLLPPKSLPLTDEDSLMNEAAQLDSQQDEQEELNSENSDLDDDEGDESLAAYNKVLKELVTNQYAYDKYMQLCELSHATGDLEMIRKAYNRFASMYPLASDIWLKYLRVEMNVAQSPNEIKKVEELFRKALKDYFSIEIAKEFSALAKRCANPDNIWREILGTYALYCLQGQEFFKSYRQYISGCTMKSAVEKQNAYIESFVQELKYPLLNMEESYIEFKVFCEKKKTQIPQQIDWEYIDREYFKAKEHLHKILPFEQALIALDTKCCGERADIYIRYIRATDTFLDENVLQTIYERMVADCCLIDDHWMYYINFLEYRDEFGRPDELQELPVFQQDAIDVNIRALRNCTWSSKLYIKRMNLMERMQKPREEIQEVLESSMSAGFQAPEPAVAIWLEYLTYLRRQTDWGNEEECDILRKNFNLAWTILGKQWGVLADSNCEILQFWGRLEYGPLNDPKRGRELWLIVMESADNDTKSGLWIEFTQLEMRRDLEGARKLYQRALQTTYVDNVSLIASAWERFERCNGTIKTLTACINECQALFKYVSNETKKAFEGVPNKKFSDPARNKAMKRKSTAPIESKEEKQNKLPETSKKKAIPVANETEVSFREHETQDIDLAKDHLRIFLSNLDYNLTEEEIRDLLPELKIININLIRSANGRSRGFGYVELQNEMDVEKALSLDRRLLNGRPVYISSVLRDKEQRQKFKYSDGLEPKKIFVKSLPPDTTQDELERMYAIYGKLKDVRLVYHKSGKFKNIAYVEFEDESAAGKAVLATNLSEMRGHNICVSISAPPAKPATNAIASSKLLGISLKRDKQMNQKPRMSLIPNVVRKSLTNITPATAITKTSNGEATNTGKTNEDFRKLLLK